MADAQRDIDRWTQKRDAVAAQQKKAEADLGELDGLKKRTDEVKAKLDTAQASFKTLLTGDASSQEQYGVLITSIKSISKATDTLDDHTCARMFAEHLLRVLKGISKLDALVKALPVYGIDFALLQGTLQNVAKKV